MKENNKALLYVSLTVLSWSTVASAFKIALRHVTYYELLVIASLTALATFAAVITFRRKWHFLKDITRREWLVFALAGLLNPAGYYLILFKAYDLLPAQIAQPINYAWPLVLSVLLAIFARQRIPAVKYIGMVISLAGVALISLGPGQLSGADLSVTGILLAFFSAFVWATFWLVNRMSRLTDHVAVLFLNFLFGSIWLLLIAPFMQIHAPSWAGLFASVYSGLFEMAIPFIFFGLALKKTDNPALINHLCFLSPFLSLFLIHLVLGENIYPSTYTGLFLIIGGILFNEYIAGKKKSGASA
ncbi:MAG: DMT family transporter [Petrimonas sp.]|nr:DMT family transporter [Petrimonas sp.]